MTLQESLIKTIGSLDEMDNLIVNIAIKKLQELKTNKEIEVDLTPIHVEPYIAMNSISNTTITYTKNKKVICHDILVITISYDKEKNTLELLFNPSLVTELLKIKLD